MRTGLSLALVAVGACGGGQAPPASPAVPELAAVATPDVVLRAVSPAVAVVGSQSIPIDGVAEGLAWPALRAAVNRKPGDHAPLAVAVPRDLPLNTVLRVVWTLRDADLRVQTPDAAGVLHVLPLLPRPEASSPGCHLAVFVAANGDLRVAYPGGPRAITGPDASGALARALAVERTRCAIRYVAFGAENASATWSSVFDVADAIERGKSAGDARYVLGEPVHVAAAR